MGLQNKHKKLLSAIMIFAFLFVMPGVTAAETKQVAIVLFNFQDKPEQPYTMAFANSMADRINAFYQEASFGKLSLDVNTFGYYTIPSSGSCDYNGWSNDVNEKAQQAGVNLNSYDNVIYVFPYTSACTWTGLSQFGGKKSWNNGRFTLGVTAHEFGHNLGIEHSNTYRCYGPGGQRVTISNNCVNYEYTDPYDLMGSGTFSTNWAAHFNNFQKGAKGWFSPSNKQTVTQSGTYTITSSELTSSAVQSLRIQKDSTRYYYLEFRKAYGFDNYWRFQNTPVVNGASIRLGSDYGSGDHSYLLDMTPETLSFEDAPLAIGKTFTDVEKGLTITPISKTADTLTVQITLGGNPPPPPPPACVRQNPTMTMSVYNQGTNGVKYTVTLKNNDNALCGSSGFNVTSILPPGLVQTPKWVSVTSLAPGSTASFKVTVNGSANGVITEKAINKIAPAFSTLVTKSYPI